MNVTCEPFLPLEDNWVLPHFLWLLVMLQWIIALYTHHLTPARVYLRYLVPRAGIAGHRQQPCNSDRSHQSALHAIPSRSHAHPPCRRAPAFPPICQWNRLSNFWIFARLIVQKRYCFVCISPVNEIEQLSIWLSINAICTSFSLNWTFVSLAQFFSWMIGLCHISFWEQSKCWRDKPFVIGVANTSPSLIFALV